MPLKYAAPWKRGAAFLLDAALVAPLALFAPLAGAGALALSGTLFEASGWQATPGKRWLGLRVIEAEGRRVDLRRAAVRHFVRAAPLVLAAVDQGGGALALAVLLAMPALAGGRRRSLWDRVSGTSVIAPPIGPAVPPPHRVDA
jgi:uncharacterized RDD family membrane protein YckC